MTRPRALVSTARVVVILLAIAGLLGAGVPRRVAISGSGAGVDSAVVVHYFHRTLRCQTCLTIEAYTREALESSFQSALADGRLVWRPLNLEAPGNAHCEEDFALQFNSVIVTAPAAADSVRWWNLDGVWDLVGDKATFLEYIRLNVGGVLQRGAPPALPKPE